MADQIFRFEVFCRSRQLGDILAMLTGRVARITPPQLVTNVTDGAGGIRQSFSRKHVVGLFALYIKDHKLTELSANDVRHFVASIGGSPNSYTYYLNHAKAAGMLRKVGEGTTSRWKVNAAKIAALAKEGDEARQQLKEIHDGEERTRSAV